ncbi:MAG TPA: hypothetical protein PKD48_05540 [Sphingopyxis sp.]|nr:hypothetical protein [Sphingopyxis sp.]HMQ17907.1 hypothetical protein [Sphingopyxis sp.]
MVLPGLVEDESPANAEVAITIRRGLPGAEAPEWVAHPEGAEFTPDWAKVDHLRSTDGRWYRIRYDYRGHVADFSIRRDGREITVHAGEGEADSEVCNLIEGPILGRAMRLAGLPCLHATALAADGKAVALMGTSGAGKSSLAWALVQQGCRLVTDDMVGLSPGPQGLFVQPGRARLRMWPDVAERLGVEGAIAGPLFPTAAEMGKIGIRDPAAAQDKPVRLHAIYRVLPRDPMLTAPAIAEMPASERLAELAANLHGVIPPAREERQRELTLLARVAASVPVYSLTLPDDLQALPAITAQLRHRLFA